MKFIQLSQKDRHFSTKCLHRIRDATKLLRVLCTFRDYASGHLVLSFGLSLTEMPSDKPETQILVQGRQQFQTTLILDTKISDPFPGRNFWCETSTAMPTLPEARNQADAN